MDENNRGFDWAIAPTTREAFFADAYEKKHLVLKRGQADYYSGLLSMTDIDRAISSMGLFVPEVSVTKAGGNITATDYSFESGFVDPVRVNQLYADGATIILGNLQERMPKLAAFCRSLEKAFSARIQTNIYLTPAHSQGFRAHYDSHDVLVLQLEGTKEWRIYDTPVELPLDAQSFNPSNVAIGEETDRFVLEPGDMAYVPRGLTHDAVATDQHSLHITTGLMVQSWIEVLHEVVGRLAFKDVAFRESLPPGFANQGFDIGSAKGKFASLIKILAEEADCEEVLGLYRDDFIGNRMARVDGQMDQVSRLPGLTIDSRVGARPDLIYKLGVYGDGDEATAQVLCQGTIIEMPSFVEETLAFALEAPDFRVGDMPGDLDDAGKLVLARRLVREGLMMFRD